MSAPQDTFRAIFGTGLHQLERGDEAAARKWFAQASRSDDPDLLADLGTIYHLQLGDPVRAEGCYRRAAEAGSPVAMNNLGVLLKQRDDLAEAEVWLRRAAAAGHVDALNNLGTVYERRGDTDRAIEYFRAAVEAGVPSALYPLVLRLSAAGRHDEADEWHRHGVRWGHPEIEPQLEFLALVLAGARDRAQPPAPPVPPASPAPQPGPPITVDTDDLVSSAERARGVHVLTDDPVPLDLALGLAGLALDGARRGDRRISALSLIGDLERLRFERDGDPARLRAAIRSGRAALDEALPTDPSYPVVLSRLGSTLVALAEQTGEPAVLREALELHEEAIGELTPGDPRFAELQTGYGIALLARAATGGDPGTAAVDAAILAHRAAVQATPPGDPERTIRQVHLAVAVLRRFELAGARSALNEARELLDRAHAELPAAHRLRTRMDAALARAAAVADPPAPASGAAALEEYRRTGDLGVLRRGVELFRASSPPGRHGLGVALTWLYQRLGEPGSLDEAIEQLGAEAADPESADVAALADLAGALRLRARRRGGDDLRRALSLARTAVRRTAPDDPRRAPRLGALASIVLEVGAVTQDSLAVREGVDLFRAALAATPADGPEHPGAAVELGNALLVAHGRYAGPEAVAEAVRLTQAAVAAVGPGDPARAAFETAAAHALHRQGLLTGNPADRDRAAVIARSAVAATPEDHPDRPERLGLLVQILLSGSELDPLLPRLDEVIRAAETWAAGTPDWHPRWAEAQTRLAHLLAFRAVTGADAAELLAAAAWLRKVATNPRTAATERVLAADRWAHLCRLLGDGATAREAYALAIDLLPRTARRGLARADREQHLGSFAGLASRAAACALDDGRVELAVQWLEQGRGVLLDQSLQVRTGARALHEQHPALAAEFTALVDALDPDPALSAVAHLPGRYPPEGAQGAMAHQREELDRRLDEVLAEIRRLPGFARFQTAPTAAELGERAAGRLVVVINVADVRCDAILLGRGAPAAVRLPGLDLATVRGKAAEFRAAIVATRDGTIVERVAAQRTVSGLLGWLWDAVAEPVLTAARITGEPTRPRVWWVPTGPLVELPLHAAGRHDADGVRHRRTVLDRVISSYLPTVRTLPTSPAEGGTLPITPAEGGTPLRMHTPPASAAEGGTPSSVRTPLAAADGGAPPSVLAVAMRHTPGAEDLPHVRAEVDRLRTLLPATTVLADEAATWSSVLPALRGHSWAHFACHVSGSAEHSADIRLLLHDHAVRPVSLADIVGLRLPNAELAYLSACDTGRAPTRLADEAVHVAGAFRMAGFAHVVATMWAVGDQAATEVSAAVYPVLLRLGAAGTALALDAAVVAQRDRYPATPSRWAAHVHVGS